MIPVEPTDPVERLAVEAERVARRLSTSSPARLSPVAAQVRATTQTLADVTAELAGQPSRVVPEVAVHALGDQVLVLAQDLAEEVRRGQADGAGDAAARGAKALTALRRAL